MIKRFSQISSKDIATCWWKGASLGEMTQAGFSVPNGFVLTTKAFWLDPHQRDNEVLHAFDKLNCKFVAVRSSWTKEDGIDDSFAGQFDTYLFVTKEKLIEQIIECHNSVNSERIKSYCESKNINRDEIKVAVVIQKMINSDVAGVCFTVNPVSWNTDEIMIEAGYGVGEVVVSGMITPDNYIVHKVSGKITKNISEQSKKLVLDISKWWTREESVESTIASVQKLSDKHISELAELAKKTEKHYGMPMDTEWAVEDEKLYMLQARPVTTINIPTTKKWKKIRSKRFSLRLWENRCYGTCEFKKEFWVIFPDQTIIIKDGFWTWYVDEDQLKKSMDKVMEIIYEKWFEKFFEKKWVPILKDFLSFCIEFKNINFSKYTNDELIAKLNNFLKEEDERMHFMWIIFLLDETLTNNLKFELTKKYSLNDQTKIISDILSQEQKTDAIQHKLDLLKVMVKKEEKTITESEFLEEIKKLTKKYEYFTTLNMDEKELQIDYFNNLAIQLLTKWTASSQLEQLKESEKNHIESSKYFFEKHEDDKKFCALLNACKKVWFYRERRNDIRQKTYFYVRMLYIEIAKRLNISIDQVIYLNREEIRQYLKHWKKVEDKNIFTERKMLSALQQINNNTKYIFDPIEVQNIDPNIELQNSDNIIKWMSIYPWKVSGIARVIFDITRDQSSFSKWDILVATTTNLAFISLITKAWAVVTDEWWMLWHTAIVTRELKIPCIVWSKVWTKIIKNWDKIEVDANSWIVKVLPI